MPASPLRPPGKVSRHKKSDIPFWGYLVIGFLLLSIGITFFSITHAAYKRISHTVIPEDAAGDVSTDRTHEVTPINQIPAVKKLPVLEPSVPEPEIENPRQKQIKIAKLVLKDCQKSHSTSLSIAQREIALLTIKDNLWVNDFEKIAKLQNAEKMFTSTDDFLKIFGKPDSEYVHSIKVTAIPQEGIIEM